MAPLEPAAGSTVKQKITLQQGIPIEKAKEIVLLVKNSKKKAQASIQADVVRISGKDRDTLQDVIAMVKQQDFGIDLQFTNYRTQLITGANEKLGTTTTINGKEIFDLLRDDIVAIEEQFGRDTVSNVAAITEIGEYLRAGGGKRIRPGSVAAVRQAARIQGHGRRQTCVGRGNHPYGDAGPRRHHR